MIHDKFEVLSTLQHQALQTPFWREIMNAENYIIARPPLPTPFCLATVFPESQRENIFRIETDKKKRIYTVRAVISEHIPLAGNIPDLIAKQSKSLLDINGNPLTVYLHHTGTNAVFYDLVPREDSELSHIDVEVEADHPDATFAPARTAINKLLDTLMREIWVPLIIFRLDVFEEAEEKPLLHELHIPYPTKLVFGPMGGYDSYPLFAAYEALVREAIEATSPYYRLLCAYKLYEGVNELRHKIRKYCEQLRVTKSMPKPPKITPEFIGYFGFAPEFANKINKFDDLIRELKKSRDSIAHFFLKESSPIHISDGQTYRYYSAASALLLHYTHEAVNDLRVFFNQNISSHLYKGSILPEIENRKQFVIKAESYWNKHD